MKKSIEFCALFINIRYSPKNLQFEKLLKNYSNHPTYGQYRLFLINSCAPFSPVIKRTAIK